MQDEHFMRRAISLAYHGAGQVSPNPMVGAVLVHQSRIIGEGWHARYGEVHAEVDCLNSVEAADRPLIPESTMYVTLEPCAHHGRQPPCAHRLVQEGIRRVVVGVADPYPKVTGRGVEILKQAGIYVDTDVCKEEATWLARRFFSVQQRQRPYIILKWAQSADGFFAPATPRRLQLSNQYSQTLVHQWRASESAILVGYNTALIDNPELTTRHWGGPNPLRIVLDRKLSLPHSHHVADGHTPTWIVNEKLSQDGNIRYLHSPFDVSLLPTLLQALKEAGRNSLLVEGGVKTINLFTQAGLWDEARVFKSPQTLGSGIPAPLLTDAALKATVDCNTDILRTYQPSDSPYPYQPNVPF